MVIHIDASLGDLMRMESVGGRLVPEGLAEKVQKTRFVDEKYWYGIEDSAAAYIALIKRQNGYKIYDDAMSTLLENLPDIIPRYDCKTAPPPPVNLCGHGQRGKGGHDT